MRFGFAQQPAKANLKRHAVDTTQATARHFAQGHAIVIGGQQRGIQTNQAEFIDQHRPTFVRRTLRQQITDQAGLASTQGAGN